MQATFFPAQWAIDIPVIAGTSCTPHPHFEYGFNIANHVLDDANRVLRHRDALKIATGLHGEWLWLNQVHSATVATDTYLPNEADALINRDKDKIAVVMTADCVPVLLSNGDGTETAAIHAGWPGLYKRIISATLSGMRTPTHALYAYIGPCATQANYEVDTAFFQRFVQQSSDYEKFFQPNRQGHYLADLVGMARLELMTLGMPREHITGGEQCSIADTRFFSHRRDGKQSGRMATFIGKMPSF